MINPIDRTTDLVKALSAQHSVEATAESTLKLIHLTQTTNNNDTDDKEEHEFTKIAKSVIFDISEMINNLQRAELRYKDFSSRGMQDHERDTIDAGLSSFLSTTLSKIDELKTQAVMEVQSCPGASFPAHKLGVVVILNDKLTILSQHVEQLRACRIRHALSERERRRQIQYDAKIATQLQHERRQLKNNKMPRDIEISENGYNEYQDNNDETLRIYGDDYNDNDNDNNNNNNDDDDENDNALLMQEFERENMTLVNELVKTREQVREAERTVHAIANMNQMFATKVVEQAKEIETLYGLAVEATRFVQRGNAELRKMSKRPPYGKYCLAVTAIVLSLALLVLEWAGRRRFLPV